MAEKKYNILYKNTEKDKPRPFRSGVTEEQVDIFWNSLKFWEKHHIVIEEVKERGDGFDRI